MNRVWMKSGTAIQRIVSGFETMTSPLNEKSRTSVSSRAEMVIGVRTCRNLSRNQCSPFHWMIQRRDA